MISYHVTALRPTNHFLPRKHMHLPRNMWKVPRKIIKLKRFLIMPSGEIVLLVRPLKESLCEKFLVPHNIVDLPQY